MAGVWMGWRMVNHTQCEYNMEKRHELDVLLRVGHGIQVVQSLSGNTKGLLLDYAAESKGIVEGCIDTFERNTVHWQLTKASRQWIFGSIGVLQ